MISKPFSFSGRISNCYDSHVHWRATGGFSRKLPLHHLKSKEGILWLKPKSENYTGVWLMGYGWDQNQFTCKNYPSRTWLDDRFGETPVYFIRVDGHAAWVNTSALKLTGLWQQNLKSKNGGKILLGDDGYPSGVFIDLAMREILKHIPNDDCSIKEDLLAGQAAFHRAGFTHIRDLTCDDRQWEVACALAKNGVLKLAVEQFFSADDPSHFHDRVRLAIAAKNETHTCLRAKGVKVYFDGALGSEGALISQPYASGSGRGLQLLERSELLEMITICFKNNLEIAIHAIGDEASHIISEIALELKDKNIAGRLHLEHAELLRPETIQNLKKINAVCHLQPCHWLSDKKWLREKIGKLAKHAFRWNELDLANIEYYFGSDSPIEKTSVMNNLLAVQDACENEIPMPQADYLKDFNKMVRPHSHPDKTWCPDSFSEFESGELTSVIFQGEKIN